MTWYVICGYGGFLTRVDTRMGEQTAMNWMSYHLAVRLARQDTDFYALIMAAMMRADSDNAARLRQAFPSLWYETQERYDAPGGLLEGETMTEGMSSWLAKLRLI